MARNLAPDAMNVPHWCNFPSLSFLAICCKRFSRIKNISAICSTNTKYCRRSIEERKRISESSSRRSPKSNINHNYDNSNSKRSTSASFAGHSWIFCGNGKRNSKRLFRIMVPCCSPSHFAIYLWRFKIYCLIHSHFVSLVYFNQTKCGGTSWIINLNVKLTYLSRVLSKDNIKDRL